MTTNDVIKTIAYAKMLISDSDRYNDGSYVATWTVESLEELERLLKTHKIVAK